MKKLLVLLFISFLLVSCKNYNVTSSSYDSNKEIDIIFASNSSENIFSYKDDLLNNTPNVTVVGCGNITSCNDAFDYSAIGEDEFQNGLDSFYSYTKDIDYKYLACNLSYNGQIKDIFKHVSPYVIVDYDGIKVAYIAITSPEIKNTINEKLFMENDNVVVNFYDEEPEVLYDTIQESIDNVKNEGAKYVILLSYLDSDTISAPYSAFSIINNLSNVDVILDGNIWSTPCDKQIIKDKDNKDVIFSWFNKDYNGYGLITIDNEKISVEYK